MASVEGFYDQLSFIISAGYGRIPVIAVDQDGDVLGRMTQIIGLVKDSNGKWCLKVQVDI